MLQINQIPVNESLINTLSIELAILLATLLIVMLYATFTLRSLFGFFGWMLMIIALMFSIFSGFPVIWFWITVVVEVFILMLAAIAYTRAIARANN